MRRLLALVLIMLAFASEARSNPYYTHGSFPTTGSAATSAAMRAELDLITAGFDLLPTLSGNASKVVVINASGTALGVTTGTLSLAGNFALTGAYATTLTVTAATTLTLPTTGTLATLAGTESLTNKTLVSPILSGTTTGTYTLSSPILSGSVTGIYTLAGTPTITSPTISSPTISSPTISSPIFSGTATGTYTLAGTPTLTSPAITSPTISSPVLSGTTTGTYTLAGTPSLTSPTITTGTVAADPTAALGIASKQYVDALWTTGDVKLTLKTTADSGWVLMNDGTIGDATSGGTSRANADVSSLFTLLWTNCANAQCAVSTGRGGSAAADFAAHKTLALPKALGRALAQYGSGSGLTARALGETAGAESVTLTAAQSGLPSHSHTIDFWSGTGAGGVAGGSGLFSSGAFSTNATGGSAASSPTSVMQPTVFLNVMIKL